MINDSILSDRIGQILSTLDPFRLQAVVEEYARLTRPQYFSSIQVYGRKTGGRTIKGWPDAWSYRDGKYHCIETTSDKNWRLHVIRDIEHARHLSGPLGAYVFVATHPTARLSIDEVQQYRREFASAGFNPENIDLIGAATFATQLSHPLYARLRLELLSLAPVPRYFSMLHWDSEISRLGAFEPTREEYMTGLVHRPALADDVELALADRGWAIVLGRGASGKTVLGRLLSLTERFRRSPCFYLDLRICENDAMVRSGAVTDLVEFGYPESLFIVDNVHLNEDIVQYIFDNYRSMEIRPHLLLLGRETNRAAGTAFSGPHVKPFLLRAGLAELNGVYRRLASRALVTANSIRRVPEPSESVLMEWATTFGGKSRRGVQSVDLMCFSAALSHRVDRVLGGDWILSEADAKPVAISYLSSPVSTYERVNLTFLAFLPEDFQAYALGLPHPVEGFALSVETGVVFELERGPDKLVAYNFAHSALGRLIREVAGSELPREALAHYAEVVPASGFALASSYLRQGYHEAASVILKTLSRPRSWISRYNGNFFSMQAALSVLIDQKIAAFTDIDRSASVSIVLNLMYKSPLDSIVWFLRFARDVGLGRWSQIIINEIFNPGDMTISYAASQSISSLSGWLSVLRNSNLSRAYPEWVDKLGTERHLSSIAEKFCREALGTVIGLTEHEELAVKVLDIVDEGAWLEHRSKDILNPREVVKLGLRLEALGKSELCQLTARLLLEIWRAGSVEKIHINTLTTILRLAALNEKETCEYVGVLVTEDWLTEQYTQAQAGTIAGSLFWVIANLPPSMWKIFDLATLRERVEAEVIVEHWEETYRWNEILALCGILFVFGDTVSPLPSIQWLSDEAILKILDAIAKNNTEKRLGTIETQMCLGVQAVLSWQDRAVQPNAKTGEIVLHRLKLGLPFASVDGFTVRLVTWLERAAADRWLLTREFGDWKTMTR
jgi:hypothetical protein